MMQSNSIGNWFGCRALLMTLLFGGTLWAQQAEVSGYIHDPSGAVVVNAEVSIRNSATKLQLKTKSNESGVYVLPLLPPGLYQVTISASGFEQKTVEGIRLEVGAKVTLNADLNIGSTSQSVTVDGSGITVNTTDGSVSTVVDRQFVDNIPLNGRSFQSLMALVPGVSVVPSQGAGQSGELSVNGQRSESNYFLVDGVSANTGAAPSTSIGFGNGFSGSLPGETVLGTTQSLVSIDALEEFRAVTSTYSAEYGRTPGGQFSFNTRSGTNDWHGSVFDYLRNDSLDANNWFNNQAGLPRQAERQNDFGGTLGGPVIIPGLYDGRNRTFFFFSYEGLRLTNPNAVVQSTVPTIELRQNASSSLQPILNAYPLPNGPDRGDGLAYFSASFSSPASLDSTSIRLDHTFGDRFRVFGRFSHAPGSTTTRATYDLATKMSTSGEVNTVTLGATNILTPIFSNDFRFNYTQNNQDITNSLDAFGGATPFALNQIEGLGAGDWFGFNFLYGLYPLTLIQPQSVHQQQINLTDSMNASVGKHGLKWGVDYRRIANAQALPHLYEYGYVFDQSQVSNDSVGGFLRSYSRPAINPAYQNFSLFFQDEWKVSSRLNVSLGLRWDINPAPADTEGNAPYTVTTTNLALAQLAPQGTALWRTTYGNLAPRLGVAYRIGQKAGYETVIRAGSGLFYDTGNTQASGGYNGIGMSAMSIFSGAVYPASQTQLASLPAISVAAPYDGPVMGYDPHLKLPYVIHWNASVEQELGTHQSLTMSYVGSAGRRLLLQRLYQPETLGNASFSNGNGLYLTTNGASSDYDALQVQFQRKLTHGLQALVSYTWSHALDDATSNYTVNELERASSDYDIRNNLQSALTYEVPRPHFNRFVSSALGGWALDLRLSARSALPVDVIGATGVDPSTGAQLSYHPDLVTGVPIYLQDANAPGGRVINYKAFLPAEGEGSLGRNSLRGFDAVQIDLAVRREFALGENVRVQFRAEAFNLFNHLILGSIYNQLTDGPELFGQAYGTLNSSLGGLNPLYQTGGPRSLQLALRLHF